MSQTPDYGSRLDAPTDFDPMTDGEDEIIVVQAIVTTDADIYGGAPPAAETFASAPDAAPSQGTEQPMEKPPLAQKASEALQTATGAIGSAAGKAGTTTLSTASGLGTAFLAMVKRSPIQTVVFFASLLWLWESTRPNAGKKTKAVVGKIGDVAHQVQDSANQLSSQVQDTATQFGSQIQDKASQLGHQVQDTATQLSSQVQDKASQLSSQVQDKATQLGSQAQDSAQQATGFFQRMLQENPLAVGALAVVFGAALGFAVPETDKENELMGPTRDNLVDQAQATAQELAQKAAVVAVTASTAAHDILDTAKGAAGDVLDSTKTAAQDALAKTQTAAHDALDHIKDEAKNQGLPLPE